ncbi:MAG TPA: GIY-YIG nuclease family protein [Candidatus Paceibacterota bacterium]
MNGAYLHGVPLYYTYVLQSLRDTKLYIGSTSDLKKRFQLHQVGQVFATKGRLPVKLIFYEAFQMKDDAIRREKYFKTNPGKRSLRLMLKAYFSAGIRPALSAAKSV